MSTTQTKKILFIDIETNTRHDNIWCCCTFKEGDNDVKVFTDPEGFINELNGMDTVCAHNGHGFDYRILSACWGVDFTDYELLDTLVLSRLANPIREGGHSLKNWGSLLGFPKDTFTDFDGGLTDEMIQYCQQDVRVLHRVYKEVTKELKDFSQQSIDLEHAVAAIISEQVANGFKVDVKMLLLYMADLRDALVKLEVEIQGIFEPTIIQLKTKTKVVPFNPNSRQQIADRLIKMGWKPKQHTDKGNIIVNDDVLAKIDLPGTKQLTEHLLLQKRLAQAESWFEAVGKSDRVYGGVLTIGANTGRMSHNSPNMAQIPAARSPYGETCRAIWTVDKGNVLVGADLSGIELRCFAHYLNDQGYTDEIVHGDVHTRNQHLFGVQTRDMAKTVLYAGLYGASPSKLASIIGGNTSDGARLRDGFNLIPGYTKLVQKIGTMAAKGWLPGLDGRRLIIRSQHAALNLLLQGAGAVIFKQWLVLIKKYLTDAKVPYKIVASVHDEVQCEVREDYGDVAGKLIVQAAEDVASMLNFRCPIAAEYKTGHNWFDTH